MAPEMRNPMRARLRRAYELGRLRRAVVASLPLVVIGLLGARIEHAWMPAAAVGPVLFAVAVFCFWRGQHLGRGVLPGVAAGIVPFAAMHAARAAGHVCCPGVCTQCVVVCIVGGTVAGLAIARVVHRSGAHATTWLSAAVIASLTGALGCASIGWAGVAGLLAGMLLGSVPLVARASVAGGRG